MSGGSTRQEKNWEAKEDKIGSRQGAGNTKPVIKGGQVVLWEKSHNRKMKK